MLNANMLSSNALIALHDTGLHLTKAVVDWARDGIHQPVERLIAQWLSNNGWDRVSFHDDHRDPFRHGVTIMQRKVDLSVPCDDMWDKRMYDASVHDCNTIQEGGTQTVIRSDNYLA